MKISTVWGLFTQGLIYSTIYLRSRQHCESCSPTSLKTTAFIPVVSWWSHQPVIALLCTFNCLTCRKRHHSSMLHTPNILPAGPFPVSHAEAVPDPQQPSDSPRREQALGSCTQPSQLRQPAPPGTPRSVCTARHTCFLSKFKVSGLR